MTIPRSDVVALLEDGPKTLQELSGWLGLGIDRLPRTLQFLGIPVCQRCRQYFIPAPHTAGKFCTRACYAPNPGPSHAKQPKAAPSAPSQRLGDNGVRLYPKARTEELLEDLDEEAADPDVEPELGALDVQPPPPRRPGRPALRQPPAAATVSVDGSGSWWVNADRAAFSQAAREKFERMRTSKEGAKVPVRILL